MDSILDSVKKVLGISAEYTVFDPDIIMHINTAFFTLSQLGVGPEGGFLISSKDDTWDSYISEQSNLEAVKSYVYLRVRILFDPPSSSYVLTSMENQIKELEWRLNVEVDRGEESS